MQYPEPFSDLIAGDAINSFDPLVFQIPDIPLQVKPIVVKGILRSSLFQLQVAEKSVQQVAEGGAS